MINSDPDIFKWFFNTTINIEGIRIVLSGFEILLLMIIASVVGFYYIEHHYQTPHKFDHLKAILPWIVLYSLLFFFVRGIPAVFILTYELKSITDFLDIALVFLIIFFAILQIISVPDSKEVIPSNILYSPLKWTDHMPKYSKILLLLFLNTEIFFQDLQENALATLTGEVNTFTTLKAVSLVSFIVIGFYSVYFRYKPHEKLTESFGPIKFMKNEFTKFLSSHKKNSKI